MPPKPTRSKRKTSVEGFRIALSAIATVGILAFSVAINQRLMQQQSPYRRYVSPALPDGSRYTFLYPKYLLHVREGWHKSASGMVQSVRIDNSPAAGGKTTVQELVQHWLRPLLRLLPTPNASGSVTVVVGEATPPAQGPLRDLKTVQVNANPNGRETVQVIYVVDARYGLRFKIYDDQMVFHTNKIATSPVVFQSFRVLPPGSAIPEEVSP